MNIRTAMVVLVHLFHVLSCALLTCVFLLPFLIAIDGVSPALLFIASGARLASVGCFFALIIVAVAIAVGRSHVENRDERETILAPLITFGALYFLMLTVSGLVLANTLHISMVQVVLWALGHINIWWMHRKPSPPSPPSEAPNFLEIDGKRYLAVPLTRNPNGKR